jgi:aspartate aminotransferase-like enzyme
MRRKYSINLSCGQTALYPEALVEMSRQLHTPIYYLPYYELEVACIDQLQRMLYTTNDVLLLVGTATYGEEAAMLSVLERGDRVLTVNTGVFGQVLTDLARVVGADPVEIKLPAGQSVTPDQIRRALREDPRIKMVAVVHVETSRGTMNPVREIGAMLRQEFPDVIYFVDSVSGLAAAELRLDDWGIDICCTSGQKAVNAPQGIAIVAVSPKAWRAMETRQTPIYSLCLDLLYWRRYHASVRTAQASWYTEGVADAALSEYKAAHGPSQSYVLMKGLKAALDEIEAEGLENVWRRHEIAARALRAGVRAMGLQTLASEENAAPDATCVIVPGDYFELRRFMRLMWEEYGIATAGGSATREAQGYVGFRVGCMGFVAAPAYILPFLAALEEVLPRMGYHVRRGAALPAAQAVFAAGGQGSAVQQEEARR